MTLAETKRRVVPRLTKDRGADNIVRFQYWAEFPQDLGVLVCQCLGPCAVVQLLFAGRRARDLGLREEVWRFFCQPAGDALQT